MQVSARVVRPLTTRFLRYITQSTRHTLTCHTPTLNRMSLRSQDVLNSFPSPLLPVAVWQGRNETSNFQQRHDVEIIKDQKRFETVAGRGIRVCACMHTCVCLCVCVRLFIQGRT